MYCDTFPAESCLQNFVVRNIVVRKRTFKSNDHARHTCGITMGGSHSSLQCTNGTMFLCNFPTLFCVKMQTRKRPCNNMSMARFDSRKRQDSRSACSWASHSHENIAQHNSRWVLQPWTINSWGVSKFAAQLNFEDLGALHDCTFAPREDSGAKSSSNAIWTC